ncbi:MAG: hypothetical protein Q8O89_08570 [Nanoarchaeota archaeon]|nr:hypothetical protein [Nanoarchaeota archaeon]
MSDETILSEIEKILLEDPHVVSIYPSEKWDVPKIDYSLFKEKDREQIECNINSLTKYLNCSYVVDDFFENHDKRRTWRNQLRKKYSGFEGYYSSNNALKIANWGAVLMSAYENIERAYIGSNKDELFAFTDAICQQVTIYHEKWHLKSSEQQVEYAKQTKQAVYDALVFLSEQTLA